MFNQSLHSGANSAKALTSDRVWCDQREEVRFSADRLPCSIVSALHFVVLTSRTPYRISYDIHPRPNALFPSTHNTNLGGC